MKLYQTTRAMKHVNGKGEIINKTQGSNTLIETELTVDKVQAVIVNTRTSVFSNKPVLTIIIDESLFYEVKIITKESLKKEEEAIQALVATGLTRGDAQGVYEAQQMKLKSNKQN